MKRLTLLLIALLMATAFASAQWNYNSNHIYNVNSGYVGIGNNSPVSLLDVAKNTTGPTISVRNLGGIGGAQLQMTDNLSGADWKIKTASTGGFKIRDNANGQDVLQIEPNGIANALYINAQGFIGLGTDSPVAQLDVAKNATGPTIAVRNLGGAGGAQFQMTDQVSGADWKFKVTSTGGFKIRDNANALDVLQIEPNSAANALYINAAGYVGLGTTNPTERLSINGNVKCKQVEVSLSGWSDFVFAEDYPLMPLPEVEAFINQHKHLPGVPSEEEVLSGGSNLGEMDAILLQKIEELTLYVIQLKKENEELKLLLND